MASLSSTNKSIGWNLITVPRGIVGRTKAAQQEVLKQLEAELRESVRDTEMPFSLRNEG